MSFSLVSVMAETDCSLTVPLSVTAVSGKTTFGRSLFQRTHYSTPKIQDGRVLPSWKSTTLFLSFEGSPIWIKFGRVVQNDLSTVVIWSKSKPDVEFQYGGRLGKFNGMSSQSHLPHCRVLPPGESVTWSHSYVSDGRVMPLGKFTVTIPEPHATLQGTVTWRNQCHNRATLQGVRIQSAILKIVFWPYFIFCLF